MKVISRFRIAILSAFLGCAAHATPGPVTYNPVVKIVQGNQPLKSSYVLSITAPTSLANNTPVTVSLGFTVLNQPTGVSVSTALGFISASPATLTFTNPNQLLTTTITVDVPLGTYAGGYGYLIKPITWPALLGVIDYGATVNATVTPPISDSTATPVIAIGTPADGTAFTYAPVTGSPVTFPIQFSATVAAGGQPITALGATFAGIPLTVNATGIGTLNASGSATSPAIAAPGTYTVRVSASNLVATSFATTDVKVIVSAPAPTLTISSPASSATYALPSGGSVSVPVSIGSTSLYGNITSLTAILNGTPISLSLTGVNFALTALGTATLNLSTPGTYTLGASSANDYGTTSKSVQFSVVSASLLPTVSFLTPANNSTIERSQGDPATSVAYTFKADALAGATIKSVVVKLNGTTITPSTLTALNQPSVSGGGLVSVTTAGTYTLTAVVSDGTSTASAQTVFIVNETPPERCANLKWLTPIALNKTINGGSMMPIKFTLMCDRDFVRDPAVLIAIYEIYPDNSVSPVTVYPYGNDNPNPPTYAIPGNHYQLNFKTAKGDHRYRIEVYYPAAPGGSTIQLLGSKELVTKGKGGADDDRDDDDDDNDDYGEKDRAKGGK